MRPIEGTRGIRGIGRKNIFKERRKRETVSCGNYCNGNGARIKVRGAD